MSLDSTRRFEGQTAAQQRFLSLFPCTEREISPCGSVLTSNVVDVEDIARQATLVFWAGQEVRALNQFCGFNRALDRPEISTPSYLQGKPQGHALAA